MAIDAEVVGAVELWSDDPYTELGVSAGFIIPGDVLLILFALGHGGPNRERISFGNVLTTNSYQDVLTISDAGDNDWNLPTIGNTIGALTEAEATSNENLVIFGCVVDQNPGTITIRHNILSPNTTWANELERNNFARVAIAVRVRGVQPETLTIGSFNDAGGVPGLTYIRDDPNDPGQDPTHFPGVPAQYPVQDSFALVAVATSRAKSNIDLYLTSCGYANKTVAIYGTDTGRTFESDQNNGSLSTSSRSRDITIMTMFGYTTTTPPDAYGGGTIGFFFEWNYTPIDVPAAVTYREVAFRIAGTIYAPHVSSSISPGGFVGRRSATHSRLGGDIVAVYVGEDGKSIHYAVMDPVTEDIRRSGQLSSNVWDCNYPDICELTNASRDSGSKRLLLVWEEGDNIKYTITNDDFTTIPTIRTLVVGAFGPGICFVPSLSRVYVGYDIVHDGTGVTAFDLGADGRLHRHHGISMSSGSRINWGVPTSWKETMRDIAFAFRPEDGVIQCSHLGISRTLGRNWGTIVYSAGFLLPPRDTISTREFTVAAYGTPGRVVFTRNSFNILIPPIFSLIRDPDLDFFNAVPQLGSSVRAYHEDWTGRISIVYPARVGGIFGLRIMYSHDQGLTWYRNGVPLTVTPL